MTDLFEVDAAADEAASFALADAACRFSRHTKDVVDDKLSFSATLMRAGEVHAANRLLAEVERDVRDKEAALIETVNEVKVAESMRRDRMTRVRVARMLAVAVLGSSLLAFSAAGMALAGFLRDRAEADQDRAAVTHVAAAASKPQAARNLRGERDRMKRLKIGTVRVFLTRSEYASLRAAAGGAAIDATGLADLLSVLPAGLADKLQEAMTVATAEVEQVEETIALPQTTKSVQKKKRKAARAAQASAQKEKAEEPSEQPSPQPTETPEDEPTNGGDDGEEGGDNGEEREGEEGDGGPIVPIKP